MNLQWAVHNEQLLEHFEKVVALLKNFTKYSIEHIPREQNTVADGLANRAMNLMSDVIS